MTTPKDDVLQVAAQLFQTNGINATTIQDITQAAGMAKGGFYTYFASKDQLVLELVQHFYDDVMNKAANRATTQLDSPLATLQNTIAAELDVATDYQNFMHAVALDFPPNSTGPVPETLAKLHRQLHLWHKHILLEAFGNRVKPYLEDLVIMLEGAIHHYLVRVFWEGASPPTARMASFIAQSLHAIVLRDDQLIPAFSTGWQGQDEASVLETMSRELDVVRDTLKRTLGDALGVDDDLAAIDFVLEELHEHSPRAFLIDALLNQLANSDHLATYFTPTLAFWHDWKGTPQ